MGTYATAAALRAELELDAQALPDAAAERLIRDAERRVDRLVGPARVLETGRKLDPAALAAGAAAALVEATVLLAAAEQRDPAAFVLPAVGSVKGPDFERSTPLQGRELPAAGAIRDAAALLDDVNLRVRGGRAYA